MVLRPLHSRVGDGVRILGTVFIAVHLFMSAWLVIQFEGQYTEGQPAPTKVNALVAIDKEQTLIDVEMENSTSFLLYMVFRDYDEPKSPPSENESEDDSTLKVKDSTEPSQAESMEWLKNGRKATLASLVLICVSECLVIAGIPLRATLRVVLFTSMAACFLVVMPATYVLDLAEDGTEDEKEGDDERQSTIADQTFVAQTEQGSMAHQQTRIDNSLLLNGIRFEMMFSGYDLGLVEPENYSSVRSVEPKENDSDAKSYIEFNSQLDLKFGKNLPSMFLIPLLWFFFPAKPKEQVEDDSSMVFHQSEDEGE